MVLSIQESGNAGKEMVGVFKNGLTEVNMSDNIKMGKQTVKAN